MSDATDKDMLRLYQLLEGRWLSPSRVFAMADENGDGLVSFREFSVFLQRLGVAGWWEEHGRSLFARFDHSGDGVIDLKELEATIDDVVAKQHRERTSRTPTVRRKVDRGARLVALVAHQDMRGCLVHFVEEHFSYLRSVPLVTSETSAKTLRRKLGLQVDKKVGIGPLGGDQEIAQLVATDKLAAVFLFRDPLGGGAAAQGLEQILRLCDVYQVPYATNRASARALFMALHRYGLNGGIADGGGGQSEDFSTQRLPSV